MMRFLALLAAVALVACGPRLVDHSFSFNALQDSTDVYVMDFRYGGSRHAGARNEHLRREEGVSAQATGITGFTLVPDDLYVKWRMNSTGNIFEDTVDLRSRLPRDFTNHRVHFVVQGPQLYVYLISPERRPADRPAIGPKMYWHLASIQIYPDTATKRD
jgi:hypothetical protein